MTNIVQLTVPSRIAPLEARITALLASFAKHRRNADDVFWLKENAELLNVLECTGQPVPQEALNVHAAFYEQAESRLTFFPQYYRFLLSLALDLEDLGFTGNAGARMVEFAASQGLADAELSDLQRAEARRLMARRDVTPRQDPGLDDRLRAFCARTATFALPNKKAAYELTHIVFYLSEYGRVDPDLAPEALESLHFAGLTAFLEQNADLLAEICIAMRYAGATPPEAWTAWLEAETAAFTIDVDSAHGGSRGAPLGGDDYHEFLICNWHQAVMGASVFRKPLAGERLVFARGRRPSAALRELSQALLEMERRSGDWEVMRWELEGRVSDETWEVLQTVAHSSTFFAAYFEGFARAGAA